MVVFDRVSFAGFGGRSDSRRDSPPQVETARAS
jgi:hypothetical protein